MVGKEAKETLDNIIGKALSASFSKKAEESTVKAIQWKGDNFEDLEKVVKAYLSGYAYRKDDDVVIDYNDGASIKRMKPLDWILVNDDDNDISVMTDKMFRLLCKSLKSTAKSQVYDEIEEDKDEGINPEDKDDGVDINIKTQYGDIVKISSSHQFFNGEIGDMMLFDSAYGDHLEIAYHPKDHKAYISMKDRYGNKVTVDGVKLTISGGRMKTGAQMFEKIRTLIDSLEMKTDSQIKKVRDLVNKAKEKSI